MANYVYRGFRSAKKAVELNRVEIWAARDGIVVKGKDDLIMCLSSLQKPLAVSRFAELLDKVRAIREGAMHEEQDIPTGWRLVDRLKP